jgi:AcrR family transcriptional regulator
MTSDILVAEPRLPRQQRRYAETLDAAAAVFAGKGYHGASTKDIADRLGIRQASLYYYFPSKADALFEVCRIGVEGFVARLRAILDGPGSAGTKLCEAVASHLTPMVDRRDYVKVFLKERHHLSGEHRRRVGEAARSYDDLFEHMIRNGIAEGAFRCDLDPRQTVMSILGLCNSTFDWHRPEHGPIEQVAQAHAALLSRGLTAPSGHSI